MSAAENLLDVTWWQPTSARLCWRQVLDPVQFVALIRDLLDPTSPEPDVLLVARRTFTEIEAYFGSGREQREDILRALWKRHDPSTIASAERVGIPNKLWERLLAIVKANKVSGRRCWRGSAESEGMFHQGIGFGNCVEWWGYPALPGAGYDDRLWAWGAVQQRVSDASADLGALSPRLAWRSNGHQWLVHPQLTRAIDESSHLSQAPRLDAGPGYLLACIVDAMVEFLDAAEYTSRDLAVLWATFLLPVLAPTIEIASDGGAVIPRGDSDGEPDYLQTLAFFMLHPRIQISILVLDRLCTLLLAEDYRSLHQLLVDLGQARALGPDMQPDAAVVTGAIWQLIAEVARQALHRRAAARWDSGFGFKLFRKILRDLTDGDTQRFALLWDEAVHGESQSSAATSREAGALAQRLREALSTALWFPGRPPYAGGPAAQQLVDLIWLRWIDEDFLREPHERRPNVRW